jgi:hypothetical protein
VSEITELAHAPILVILCYRAFIFIKMKKVLSIILLSPVILCVVALDIIKLPLMLTIVTPFTFLICLSDMLRGDKNWIRTWLGFNLEFGCFTYMMKDELFGS